MYHLGSDDRLVFEDANPAADKILGVDNSQFIGKTIEEAFPPLVATEVPERYRRAAAQGESWHTEQIDYKDEKISGAFEVHAFQTEPGKMVAMFLDITERKQAEEKIRAYFENLEVMVAERTRELRDAQEKLFRQKSLAVLGELAGGVGHELRNPLGVITNASYFLNMTLTDADAKTQEHLQMIDSEAKNATRIISDLLDFARVKSADRSPAQASKLVAAVLSQHPAPDNVTTKVDIPDDLPPLFVDSLQIEQVLGNLVDNAYQAMLEGGKLFFEAHMDGEFINLAVSDTGVGISPDDIDKIFEPLFTTKQQGIGLGLAISSKLVQANDGRIRVESKIGKGTVFTLIMPIGET